MANASLGSFASALIPPAHRETILNVVPSVLPLASWSCGGPGARDDLLLIPVVIQVVLVVLLVFVVVVVVVVVVVWSESWSSWRVRALSLFGDLCWHIQHTRDLVPILNAPVEAGPGEAPNQGSLFECFFLGSARLR